MTRENKLALVVGFGLILFVGILISDHFSAAQNEAAANLASGGVLAGRSTGLNDPNILDMTGSKSQVKPGITVVVPDPVEPPSGDGPHQPETENSPTSNVPAPNVTDPDVEVATGHVDEPGIVEMPNPYRPRDNTPSIEPGSTPTTLVQGPLPGEKSHQVGRGETLYAIAKKHYGDGSLWPKLLEFNKDRVPDVDALRPGVTLRVPTKGVLTGEERSTKVAQKPDMPLKSAPPSGESQAFKAKPNQVAMGPSNVKSDLGTRGSVTDSTVTPVWGSEKKTPPKTDNATSSKSTKTAPKTEPASKPEAKPTGSSTKKGEYTVREGDTMSKIAAKVMGSPARWQELYELNRSVIRDPHAMKPGTVLKVPSAR